MRFYKTKTLQVIELEAFEIPWPQGS